MPDPMVVAALEDWGYDDEVRAAWSRLPGRDASPVGQADATGRRLGRSAAVGAGRRRTVARWACAPSLIAEAGAEVWRCSRRGPSRGVGNRSTCGARPRSEVRCRSRCGGTVTVPRCCGRLLRARTSPHPGWIRRGRATRSRVRHCSDRPMSGEGEHVDDRVIESDEELLALGLLDPAAPNVDEQLALMRSGAASTARPSRRSAPGSPNAACTRSPRSGSCSTARG